MEIKIKKADQRKDLESISEIFRREYAKKPFYEKWNKNSALRQIKDHFKKYSIYVAESDNQIAGFVVFTTYPYYDGFRGFVVDIIVSNEFQGKGIGKRLMKKAEIEFKKRGVVKIFLGTVSKARAIKFYKKLGFRETKHLYLIKKLK